MFLPELPSGLVRGKNHQMFLPELPNGSGQRENIRKSKKI